MNWLTFAQLAERREQFDACVACTPAIDRFCSTLAWSIPAAHTMMTEPEPFITESSAGFVAMMVIPVANGLRLAAPLEIAWGLSAPFAGPKPAPLVKQVADMWAERADQVDGILVSGIPPTGVWIRPLMKRFVDTERIGLGDKCVRRMASLAGGLDGFMSRRSARFRANLRRAERQGHQLGLVFERYTQDHDGSIYERILDIERNSWKGRAGEGFDQEPSRSFYAEVITRLHQTGRLRVIFIRLDGQDVAFVFGGVFGDVYRGLQMSYRDTHSQFSLGNLGQLAMIRWMSEDGIETYDLGTEMDYKLSWAESSFTTQMFVILRH